MNVERESILKGGCTLEEKTKNSSRVLEEQQPRERNKYALCTQKQIIKKPVVGPEMVSLYKSFTEKFTDGYQNIPLQNLVFITDELNHVPFRIHRINYFQVCFFFF